MKFIHPLFSLSAGLINYLEIFVHFTRLPKDQRRFIFRAGDRMRRFVDQFI